MVDVCLIRVLEETHKELAASDPDHRPEKPSKSSVPQTDPTGGQQNFLGTDETLVSVLCIPVATGHGLATNRLHTPSRRR